MSGFGGFSQEAYDQLRQSYAQQLLKAEEAENAGVTIGQDRLGLETAPLQSPWLDKTGLWQYPDGRGEHMDVERKQIDLLAALQQEEEEVDLESLSDEEIDSLIDEVLAEIDGDDDVEEDEETMSDEEIDALVNEVLSRVNGDDDLNLEDMSDEELDAMLDEILAEVESDEEAQGADLEDEEPARDATTIAQQIAELKAELAAMVGDDEEEEEEEEEDEDEEVGEASESEDDYETSDEEETESEDDTDEEEPSDDESD